MAGSRDNNNNSPAFPLFGVVVGGAGGVVSLSILVTLLSITCIYCYKRRHRQTGEENKSTSVAASSSLGYDVRLLAMRQGEMQSPTSSLPRPPYTDPLPPSTLAASNAGFITLDITPAEFARLCQEEEEEDTDGGQRSDGESGDVEHRGFITLDITPAEFARLCQEQEEEDADGGQRSDGESGDVEHSLACTPDLPPRTEEMLEIISDGLSHDAPTTQASAPQPPLSPSQPTTPQSQHSFPPPHSSPHFSSSQPTSLSHPTSPLPLHSPSSPSTPLLHTIPPTTPPPPQSPASPSHSQSPTHSLLPPSTSPPPPQNPPSKSPSPLPPPRPPKPETRFPSNSDSDHDTTAGSSYCIMLKGPPQMSAITLPDRDKTSFSKQERVPQPVDLTSGQPLNQETTESAGETENVERKQAPNSSSFLKISADQNITATQEEQALPPRPPKPSPSPRTTATGRQCLTLLPKPSPSSSSSSPTGRGQQSRPPPIPWELLSSSPPPSLLLPTRPHPHGGGRGSEGSVSLPPRNIMRYPATSSSGSSCTAGPGITGSLDEGGGGEEEEDVFLKYNESYHTITKHFHSDRLHTH